MTALFQEAGASIKVDEKGVHEKLDHKLETIIEQNTKIAEGIVAVADMIKEMRKKHEEHHMEAPKPKAPEPRPMPSMDMGAPPPPPGPAPGPLGIPPSDLSVPPMPDFDFPEEEKKKGFFSKFRKKK